jgi:hypothetical protein
MRERSCVGTTGASLEGPAQAPGSPWWSGSAGALPLRGLESQAGARRHHRRPAACGRCDDLLGVDALQATIDARGAVQTRVRGINNRGQIAIDTVDAQLVHHGFLFDKGRFTEIRPRGATGNGSLATDVDDRGRVLGYVL